MPNSANASGQGRPTTEVRFSGSTFRPQVEAFVADWGISIGKRGQRLVIRVDPKLAEEAYRLEIGSGLEISAKTQTGVAWALQTLGQLLHQGVTKATVTDAPATPFRCVMIDVARRYHSPSTLRKIIRWAQLGKVRFIQLHLTDDQNWMLPSSLLPGIDKLNTHGRPRYTRKELADLQTFAAARGVSIIPEVEFPGHAGILCRLAPETYRMKGSASGNCINFGSPEVRRLCRAILTETAQIFKTSPYIHFGGDEAWYPDADKDPQFAQTMKLLSTDANGVFVDFVAEMARDVIRLKKTPLVWEGFGKSEFAKQSIPPETAVIAWENAYYPARELVADGYKVINAGWDPYYVVNHYPYDAFTLVPLKRLYEHDPDVFGVVNGAAPSRIGPGLLGSMMPWWEGHEWHAQSTLPSRILAFGCRLWNRKGEKSYASFVGRSGKWLGIVNQQMTPFELVVEGARPDNAHQFEKSVHLRAKTKPDTRLAFRTDTKIPHPSDPTTLSMVHSGVVTAQAFRGNQPVGETLFLRLQKVTIIDNLARGAKAWSSTPEDPQFPASLVTDGVADDIASCWMSYPTPADLTIDLGKAVSVGRIEVVPFYAAGQGLLYQVHVSEDRVNWTLVADASKEPPAPTPAGHVYRFYVQLARYIRVTAIRSLQYPPTMARIHEVRAFAN